MDIRLRHEHRLERAGSTVMLPRAALTPGELMSIHPSSEQLRTLAGSSNSGPIVMLNLLRFKPEADGIDAGATGAEAYARYSLAAEPFLRAVGGRLRAALQPQQSVIG